MKIKIAVAIPAMCLLLAACAAPVVPKQLTLTDPTHRTFKDNVGTDVEAIRVACANDMLLASPADTATDIDTRVISTGSITTVEVDAVIYLKGALGTNSLPVTFSCSYKDGHIYQTHWTRGLK